MNDKVTYYVSSSVLGGKLVSEVSEQGAKERTFVYANGGVMAVQSVQSGTQYVQWEHNDPSGASYRETDPSGQAGWAAAETDPMGANAGLVKPLSWPPAPSLGKLVPYAGVPEMLSLTGGCTLDGIAADCNSALNAAARGAAELFERSSQSARAGYGVSILGRFCVSGSTSLGGAHFENECTVGVVGFSGGMPGTMTLQPQNPSGQSDLASLISQTRDIIKNASADCAKLLGKDALSRFDAISGNIQFNGDILVHVEGLDGGVREGRLSDVPPTSAVTAGDQIYLNPKGYAFGTFYNFPALGKYFAKMGTSSQHEFALATILHEFLHTTGRFKPDSKVGPDGKINSKQSEKYQKEVLKKCFSKK